jgi:hypothetical protein
MDHQMIDERSLALGRAVAAKLAEHPELIGRARATVERWLTTCSPRSRAALEAWREVLNDPAPDRAIALLTGTDERATQLRQSNPFAGALTTAERNAIFRAFAQRSRSNDPSPA